MTKNEVMQMALDVLKYVDLVSITAEEYKEVEQAVEALRAALAQPEPEPVAWRSYDGNTWCYVDHLTDLPHDKFEPLYTEPPAPTKIFGPNLKEILNSAGFYQKKEWVGLADEEKNEITWGKTMYEILDLVEAKLKEKNHGV